ncbi:type II toxin-antitoxin system RelE/ParE family toxin [Anabaena sp. FACHB-1237]|uniref:type II toxin-antitoxin system RelE family toxin n=1 Tax=Anabaena sp. FACHB-1237 TaxID=2692769 RepID=UPI0016810299|nr:type II toxin-antitoxin system RelE/ParE family toxin [Anabaena sp. FACHB-1237]MBD2139080.1 type II toxin-antitoxin system RelE/ParE family toxin [Anabaena sp. FACHB-1237]
MTDSFLIEIRLTPEFRRRLRILAKKYRQIQVDIQTILEMLQMGEFPGAVMKVRVKNSDIQKGKSGGYRLIYWIANTTLVVLLDIYSKSDQTNIEVSEICQIINSFDTSLTEDEREQAIALSIVTKSDY